MEQLFGLLAAVLAITITPLVPPAASDATRDKDMIIASEREWAAAPVKGDASRMAEFMADDCVEIVMETSPGSRKSQMADHWQDGMDQPGAIGAGEVHGRGGT